MPKLRIVQDEDPIDPRDPKYQDNLGTMVCWHRDYVLGDKQLKTQEEAEELINSFANGDVKLPLRLYDHSGISMSTGNGYPFNDHWDSMAVGYIYVKAEKIKKEAPKGTPSEQMEWATRTLEQEVKEYNAFISGDMIGFVIYEEKVCETCGHHSEEVLESSWGYCTTKDCLAEALSLAKSKGIRIENRMEFEDV